jgi:hypothetical protein
MVKFVSVIGKMLFVSLQKILTKLLAHVPITERMIFAKIADIILFLPKAN